LESDPEERYDMAARQPRLVQEMLEALAGEVKKYGTGDWEPVAWTSAFESSVKP